MSNTITDLQNSDAWEIQLTYAEEERVMQSSSGNIKFTPYSDVKNVIDEPFESLHSKNHASVESSMKRSDFILDSVQLMYYKCHKVSFIRTDSFIDSAD